MYSIKTNDQNTARIKALGKLVLLGLPIILALVVAYYYSKGQSISAPTFHLDGAFQTASGLYRLSAGQFPGKDFYPYLGIGPLLLLYPVFLMAGAKLGGSMFASHFVVLFAAGLSVSIISFLLLPPKRWLFAIGAGVAFIFAATTLPDVLPYWILQRIEPSNSLRPLRSLLPFINVTLAYVIIIRWACGFRTYAALGALAGFGLLWSNDFGIVSSFLLICFALLLAVKNREEAPRHIVAVIFTAAIFGLGSLTLATSGSPIPLLKYNFLDVAKDQWWYFGPWHAKSRIFDLFDLAKLWNWHLAIGLAVLIGVTVRAYLRPSVKNALQIYLGLALFAGGLVASVGGHIEVYFESFIFWAKMTILLAGVQWIYFFVISLRVPYLKTVLPSMVYVALIGAGLVSTDYQAQAYRFARVNAKHNPSLFYVEELRGYLPNEWRGYIEEARTSNGHFIEEYWGIWSAMHHKLTEVPVDSVIHALGNTRSQVEQYMESGPDVVITTRRGFSEMWQSWSLSANWWFYKHVLMHYVPSSVSPTTIVWRKNDKSQQWKNIACSFGGSPAQGIQLKAKESGYYEVTVNYRLPKTSSRRLLLARNNINDAGNPAGYLSIDSTANQAIFPAYVSSPGSEQLDFKVVTGSEESPELHIESCTARKVPADISTEVLKNPQKG